MKRLVSAVTLALGLFLASAASASTYTFDSVHSAIGFKVRHLGVSWVRGEFTTWDGTVSFDDDNPTDASVEVTIQADSIDTGNEKRDGHLKSDDFLNVEEFPTITFVSHEVGNIEGDSFDLFGDLTIRDITKEVVLHVTEVTPEVAGPDGTMRRGAVATTMFNRMDFGTKFAAAIEGTGLVVGDEVHVTIDLELVEAAEEPAA